MPSLSLVVPVYNSEPCLPELHRRIVEVLEKQERWKDFELIFVDDDSRDDSWKVIESLVHSDARVRGLRHGRNFGQHNALLAGIRQAQGEFIVTLDDDLQHPPDEIPRLLAKLEEGWDVVYGDPVEEKHDSWRRVSSRITKLALSAAMGAQTARQVSAFRVFRTGLRDAFASYDSSFVSIDVLLTWATTRFASIPVRHDERLRGSSNYTLLKLIRHSLNMATGLSNFPLQIASLVGFAFTLFGGCVLAYVVGRYFIHGGSVPGFPFLASIIALFSGAQLFALGIIGEYLARMHFKTMGRPYSFVRGRAGFEPRDREDKQP